jgi:hypothetical protein
MMDSQFTATELEGIGKLINGLGVIGSQALLRHSSNMYEKAWALLQNTRQQDDRLLRRLDEMARTSGDESVLRLIEDIPLAPNDILHNLQIVRRCLAASAFLGHCVAVHHRQEKPPPEAPALQPKLH